MRMMPPKVSAFLWKRLPKETPRTRPTPEIRNVVRPIRELADTMCTSSAAKAAPVASASILVATARGIMLFGEKDALMELSSLSSCRLSRIMFPPMSRSRMKATQAATDEMKEENRLLIR